MKFSGKSLLLAAFLLAILPHSVGYQGRKGHGIAERTTSYKTGYACEGSTLHLDCEEGSVIHIVRANYGRFTISICNPMGVLDWTVKCMSTRSMRVMMEKCDTQTNCFINVNNGEFGDPCPDTKKYLEVQYQCDVVDVSVAVSQATTPTFSVEPAVTPPLPDFPPDDTTSLSTLTTLEPEVITTIRVTTLHTVPLPFNVSLFPTAHPPSQHHSTTESVTSTSSPISTTNSITEETMTTTSTTLEPTTPSTTTTMGPRYCETVKARGILWNRTLAGKSVTHICPHPSRGMAQWKCGINPVGWYPDTPDLSSCLCQWTREMDDKFERDAEIRDVAMELATETARVPLYGGDIRALGVILNKMVSKLTATPPSKEDFFNVSKAVMKAGSNLLDISRTQSWTDLSREEMTKTATSLVMTLENNAFLMAESLNEESLITNADENIIMGVKVMNADNIQDDVLFPPRDKLHGSDWQLTMDSISLPGKTLKTYAHNGFVKLVFFAYNNLGSLLNNYDLELERPSNGKKFVNTRVISATINQRRDLIFFPEPVVIKFEHHKKGNSSNATCVFWNYSENIKLGYWSEFGCDLITSNDLHTICHCNHLTNFAVLMDVRSVEISPENEVALRVITYVGCIISIVCLTLSIITFILFKGLQSDRNTIHKNLCLCLLVAEVLFLVGIGQTDKPYLCAVFAGLLHFFFLAAFAWMFLEGFQLYVMLIEVFESEKSRLRWYYVAAYGCPLLIVAIAASVDYQSYGTANHCWLRTDNYFIFSFVGPVVVVILANVIFLCIAVYMMCRHANIQTAIKNRDNCKTGNIKAWVRGALVLVFLLGLTWTFGLFYLNEGSTFMAYVFTVLNSLQGLFIFIFHCLRNEKVQKEYKKWVRRTDWLPENWRRRYGGHTGLTASNGTGTPGSGQNSTGHQGYFQKLLTGKKRKRSSTTSTGKSSIPGKPTSSGKEPEIENLSTKSSNRDSGHEGSNGESQGTPNQVKINLDPNDCPDNLSMIDASVVDSEFLTEYCHSRLCVGLDHNDDESLMNQMPMTIITHDKDENLTSDFSDDEQYKSLERSNRFSSSSYSDSKPLISSKSSTPERTLLNTIASALSTPIEWKHKYKTYSPSMSNLSSPRLDTSTAPRISMPDIKLKSESIPCAISNQQDPKNVPHRQSLPNLTEDESDERLWCRNNNALSVAVLDNGKIVCRLHSDPEFQRDITQLRQKNSSEC